MSKAPEQAELLRGIDTGTGEVTCPDCLALEGELREARGLLKRTEDELKGAERDLNNWRRRYADLAADKDAEAREHDLWDRAFDLFALWRAGKAEAEGRDRIGRSKFSADRFWLIVPFLKAERGDELCQRAIIGRCYHHFEDQRKNGSTIHYLEWERIFGSKGDGQTAQSNFEESVLRCPDDWRERVARLRAWIEA